MVRWNADKLQDNPVIELKKEWAKLEKNLGGIKEMKKIPDAIFIVDPKQERNCVQEAHTLGIPLIGICDTNCDPEELDAVIEGNQGMTGEEEYVEAEEETVEE